MNTKKIVTKEIKKTHPRQKGYASDQYYQRMANRLQDTFNTIAINIGDHRAEIAHRAAIVLTNYMEDIVADSGPWRMFSDLCLQLYGHPTPMYHEEEEYYADEPSKNAVRFLIWSVVSEITDKIVFSDSEALEKMATEAYSILDELFDEAPINEELAKDIKNYVQQAEKGFDEMRAALTWLFSDCYLTTGESNEDLLAKHTEEAFSVMNDDKVLATPGMALFYAVTLCIFSYKTGLLALHAKDYLAALMRQMDMQELAEDVEQMERITFGIYKYDFLSTDRLRLTRTNGRQIEIQAQELNTSTKQLVENDGFMASSFVYYQQEWHLNGILSPIKGVKEKWKELCNDDPENLAPGTETLTAEKMLKRTKGKRIAYFADREEMKDWLVEKLKFSRQTLQFVDEHGGERPTVFIDKEEPKDCLQFFFGYSSCIADPANPYYDAEKARDKAINILWDAELITTHAVNYLLEEGFLPDVYKDRVFSRHNTPTQIRADIDFLMRFWRRENY